MKTLSNFHQAVAFLVLGLLPCCLPLDDVSVANSIGKMNLRGFAFATASTSPYTGCPFGEYFGPGATHCGQCPDSCTNGCSDGTCTCPKGLFGSQCDCLIASPALIPSSTTTSSATVQSTNTGPVSSFSIPVMVVDDHSQTAFAFPREVSSTATQGFTNSFFKWRTSVAVPSVSSHLLDDGNPLSGLSNGFVSAATLFGTTLYFGTTFYYDAANPSTGLTTASIMQMNIETYTVRDLVGVPSVAATIGVGCDAATQDWNDGTTGTTYFAVSGISIGSVDGSKLIIASRCRSNQAATLRQVDLTGSSRSTRVLAGYGETSNTQVIRDGVVDTTAWGSSSHPTTPNPSSLTIAAEYHRLYFIDTTGDASASYLRTADVSNEFGAIVTTVFQLHSTHSPRMTDAGVFSHADISELDLSLVWNTAVSFSPIERLLLVQDGAEINAVTARTEAGNNGKLTPAIAKLAKTANNHSLTASVMTRSNGAAYTIRQSELTIAQISRQDFDLNSDACSDYTNAHCGDHGFLENQGGSNACLCFADELKGWWEGGHQCDQCREGFYGSSCTSACPDCGSNGKCDQGIAGTGECVCDPGFMGDHCENSCPINTQDVICSDRDTCTPGTPGTCSCPVGFTGDSSCGQCATGKFGDECKCSSPAANTITKTSTGLTTVPTGQSIRATVQRTDAFKTTVFAFVRNPADGTSAFTNSFYTMDPTKATPTLTTHTMTGSELSLISSGFVSAAAYSDFESAIYFGISHYSTGRIGTGTTSPLMKIDLDSTDEQTGAPTYEVSSVAGAAGVDTHSGQGCSATKQSWDSGDQTTFMGVTGLVAPSPGDHTQKLYVASRCRADQAATIRSVGVLDKATAVEAGYMETLTVSNKQAIRDGSIVANQYWGATNHPLTPNVHGLVRSGEGRIYFTDIGEGDLTSSIRAFLVDFDKHVITLHKMATAGPAWDAFPGIHRVEYTNDVWNTGLYATSYEGLLLVQEGADVKFFRAEQDRHSEHQITVMSDTLFSATSSEPMTALHFGTNNGAFFVATQPADTQMELSRYDLPWDTTDLNNIPSCFGDLDDFGCALGKGMPTIEDSHSCTCFKDDVHGYWEAGNCYDCDSTHYGTGCLSECSSDPAVCNPVGGYCDHGESGTGACTCHREWTGTDCHTTCPSATDDFCSGHGSCTAAVCTCESGYTGDDCRVSTTACIFDSSTPDVICSGHGSCTGGLGEDGVCNCDEAWRGDSSCSKCGFGYYRDDATGTCTSCPNACAYGCAAGVCLHDLSYTVHDTKHDVNLPSAGFSLRKMVFFGTKAYAFARDPVNFASAPATTVITWEAAGVDDSSATQATGSFTGVDAALGGSFVDSAFASHDGKTIYLGYTGFGGSSRGQVYKLNTDTMSASLLGGSLGSDSACTGDDAHLVRISTSRGLAESYDGHDKLYMLGRCTVIHTSTIRSIDLSPSYSGVNKYSGRVLAHVPHRVSNQATNPTDGVGSTGEASINDATGLARVGTKLYFIDVRDLDDEIYGTRLPYLRVYDTATDLVTSLSQREGGSHGTSVSVDQFTFQGHIGKRCWSGAGCTGVASIANTAVLSDIWGTQLFQSPTIQVGGNSKEGFVGMVDNGVVYLLDGVKGFVHMVGSRDKNISAIGMTEEGDIWTASQKFDKSKLNVKKISLSSACVRPVSIGHKFIDEDSFTVANGGVPITKPYLNIAARPNGNLVATNRLNLYSWGANSPQVTNSRLSASNHNKPDFITVSKDGQYAFFVEITGNGLKRLTFSGWVFEDTGMVDGDAPNPITDTILTGSSMTNKGIRGLCMSLDGSQLFMMSINTYTISVMNVSSSDVEDFSMQYLAGNPADGGNTVLDGIEFGARMRIPTGGATYQHATTGDLSIYFLDCLTTGNFVLRKLDLITKMVTTVVGGGSSADIDDTHRTVIPFSAGLPFTGSKVQNFNLQEIDNSFGDHSQLFLAADKTRVYVIDVDTEKIYPLSLSASGQVKAATTNFGSEMWTMTVPSSSSYRLDRWALRWNGLKCNPPTDAGHHSSDSGVNAAAVDHNPSPAVGSSLENAQDGNNNSATSSSSVSTLLAIIASVAVLVVLVVGVVVSRLRQSPRAATAGSKRTTEDGLEMTVDAPTAVVVASQQQEGEDAEFPPVIAEDSSRQPTSPSSEWV